MKHEKTTRRSGAAASINRPFSRCALNVVVYRAPGPDDNAIGGHTDSIVAKHTACRSNEGIGYLTLVASDFDRLWKGVERGDALGTAFCVLAFLGPSAELFIGREDDFIFGWNGLMDEAWGDVLLLEIIPRPHMLAAMN